jgi:hypothetical protein
MPGVVASDFSSPYAEPRRFALKRPGAPVEPMSRVCAPHAFLIGMSELPPLPTTPPEISLLLRAHAEQHWLGREVLPVVCQVETRAALPEDQLPAALAYLEVVWAEAVRRAGDTDAACTCLDLALPAPPAPPAPPATLEPPSATAPCEELERKARRYRAAVVALREGAARRVVSLLAPGAGLVASKSCSR